MKLHPGQASEYKRRHDALWPELAALLRQAGISDYSIFLDEETHTLFAVMQVSDDNGLTDLPRHPIMKKWWAYMKDIMDTHADNSPVSVPLQPVFYLA